MVRWNGYREWADRAESPCDAPHPPPEPVEGRDLLPVLTGRRRRAALPWPFPLPASGERARVRGSFEVEGKRGGVRGNIEMKCHQHCPPIEHIMNIR
jgi:hypothetical protein